MANTPGLIPAQQLAETNKANFPNESLEYRAARNALLAQEIELRRHIEQVASQRRALPPGGEIPQDGPQRKSPCPSCTSFLAEVLIGIQSLTMGRNSPVLAAAANFRQCGRRPLLQKK